MAGWLGSTSFVLFSALFGCILGFGLAAIAQGMKSNSRKQAQKEIHEEEEQDK